MSADSGMAIGIGIAILLTALVPFALIVWLLRRLIRAKRLPGWALWVGLPLAIGTGLFITFFVVFDDLGNTYLASRRAPGIELRVPAGLHGNVYAFFDSQAARMVKAASGRYVVDLPASGKVIAGSFPGIADQFSYVQFTLTAPDGSVVPQAFLSSQSGGFSGVYVRRFFIGMQAEADRDYDARSTAGTAFDEETVYRALTGKSATSP
jgi:hypothetical protein